MIHGHAVLPSNNRSTDIQPSSALKKGRCFCCAYETFLFHFRSGDIGSNRGVCPHFECCSRGPLAQFHAEYHRFHEAQKELRELEELRKFCKDMLPYLEHD